MKQSKALFMLVICLQFGFLGSTHAEIFYENNFESGAMPKSFPNGDPIWSLGNSFSDVYGPGNHFNIIDTTSHNGTYSLKFTYEARNGFCNVCGSVSSSHISEGHNSADYFISSAGENLSIADNPLTTKKDDGPKAETGKFIYNTSGGFSKWKILSVKNENTINDRINLELVLKGINGESTINDADKIAITRHCGVDGIIGVKNGENDIRRRSDCNAVITWFSNVTPQPPGTSIFRRTYLKAEITSTSIHQKLHYLRPDRDGPNSGEIRLLGDSSDQTVPDVHGLLAGFNNYGGDGVYRPGFNNGFDNIIFKRGDWYYVEEEYKAATVKTADSTTGKATEYNADGAYRLWFSKSGSEPSQSTPTFELTGITLPPITGGNGTHISLWGNLQHWTHARGSWYMDDVIVSTTWNGAVPFNGKNLAPPKKVTPD